MTQALFLALDGQKYRVERPFGALPAGSGLASDVAVDPAGRIHVLLRGDPLVDAPAPAVISLDADGNTVAAWGGDLIDDGHMLATAADGRILIVDRDAHQIVICDQNGRQTGSIGARHQPLAPFNHPTDVAVCPRGTVYVSDGYGGTRVHRFSPTGEPLTAWGEIGDGPGQFVCPHAVWVMSDGRVVVADRDNSRLQVFTPEGKLLAIWTGFHKPMDIWGDVQDRLFVTDQVPSMTLLASDGQFLGRCRPVLNGAHGVWGDAQGRLYLAELNPSRVTRLTPVPE